MDPIALTALLFAALLSLWLVRQRALGAGKSSDRNGNRVQRVGEALDTVAAWPPEATRVLTQTERRAQMLLLQALPECMVLAQLPLPRFIRVPTRNSYQEWMHRMSQLCADLVVCDASSQVLAVVEVRRAPGKDSERTQKRHARMDRVLSKAGVRVIVWNEEALPSASAVRELVLGPAKGASGAGQADARVEGTLLRRVATLTDALADPLDDAFDAALSAQPEPAPSTWFDELDAAPTPLDPLRR